ncbi:MAG: nucleotidyltransferase domain-containing protein [Synechococcaceae cyanobacterium]|nr:nucleotidyltransferase domain-containing protein [Synechococcaceae cyanobacterium]
MSLSPSAAALPRTGLPPAAIQQVLAAHPEVEQAILYGSRALGRHRPASDIDLSRFACPTHPALLAHIERVGQVLYQRASLPRDMGDRATVPGE